MSYLYVKWNSLGRGLLASGLAIKACRATLWPLPERRPATLEAARLGRSGGSGQEASLATQWSAVDVTKRPDEYYYLREVISEFPS